MGTTDSRLKTPQDTLQEDRTKFSIGLSPNLHNKINGVPAPAPQSSMDSNLSKSSDSYSINDKVQAKVNEEFLKRQKIEDYDRKCTVLDDQISNYERQLEKAVQVDTPSFSQNILGSWYLPQLKSIGVATGNSTFNSHKKRKKTR